MPIMISEQFLELVPIQKKKKQTKNHKKPQEKEKEQSLEAELCKINLNFVKQENITRALFLCNSIQ